MTTEDDWDPLDALDHPTLAECIEPYRKYGDTELAVALLAFGRRFSAGVPSLKRGELGQFAVRGQPANVGFDYYCPDCEENVRGVRRPSESLLACPLCGEEPGMLTLGRGPK